MNAEKGRVIVVTGAAKPDGIGAKTCQTFIDKEPNCHLVVLDILDDRVVEWAEGYPNVTYLHTDVASKERITSWNTLVQLMYWSADLLIKVQEVFLWLNFLKKAGRHVLT